MPHSPHILFLARSLNYGGSERQLVALVKGLRQRGQPVTVATFYSGGPFHHDLESAGVPVLSLGKRTRWDVTGFLWRLLRLLRSVRPEILHGYLGTANILTVCLKPFCPTMKIVWGVRASDMDLEQYGWLDRLLYWIECRLSRFADAIIVNSHVGLDYAVRHGFPREKMIVVSNGIDVRRFSPDHDARVRLREAWRIKTDEYLVGLVGRLDPMKGHVTFMKAAAALLEEYPRIRFVCVGDGPTAYREKLLVLSKDLGVEGRLDWISAREDIGFVYNAFDCATSCSSYGEGFSNVIGEAMACEVPCVVTDVGDGRWIVGDTGYVVGADDPTALAVAWKKMLDLGSTERRRLGQRARERIVEHFSLDRLVDKTSSILDALVR